jgi:hypothetical protein
LCDYFTWYKLCTNFVKVWVGLHFGRFINKLIWSPCIYDAIGNFRSPIVVPIKTHAITVNGLELQSFPVLFGPSEGKTCLSKSNGGLSRSQSNVIKIGTTSIRLSNNILFDKSRLTKLHFSIFDECCLTNVV